MLEKLLKKSDKKLTFLISSIRCPRTLNCKKESLATTGDSNKTQKSYFAIKIKYKET